MEYASDTYKVKVIRSMLEQLQADLEHGLIESTIERAKAEALDDLLEQSVQYHKEGNKAGAAVLTAAVFEDTIRRIAVKHSIDSTSRTVDPILEDLRRSEVFSQIMTRRCKAGVALRNLASHANWDEIELKDIPPTINLIRDLLRDFLNG